MNYEQYQNFIKEYSESYQLNTATAIDTQVMGLMGECGEVIECLKKESRDGSLDVVKLTGELGDVLAYLSLVAGHKDFSFSELDEYNVTDELLRDRSNIDYCKWLYDSIGSVIHLDITKSYIKSNITMVYTVLCSIANAKGIDMNYVRDNNYEKLLKRWDNGKQRGSGDYR